MKNILSLYFIFFAIGVKAQQSPRTVISINEQWEFTKDNYTPAASSPGPTIRWRPAHLPHTWNVADVMDDDPGYYRGICWYRKRLEITPAMKKKRLVLYFEGANQVTTVFVNGKKVGDHSGGYTSFYVPLEDCLLPGSTTNELIVQVDNRHNANIPPLSADFSFFGGIYRDVFLVIADRVHFTFGDHASGGVLITTPLVTKEKAEVVIRSTVSNDLTIEKKVNVVSAIINKEGHKIAESVAEMTLKPGDDTELRQEIKLKDPHLWTPETPYLYTIKTTISEPGSGIILDEINNPLGFRWFHFDAKKGFYLNGNSYKLVGASRHQDYEGMGNAVPDALAREDIRLLKDMGGNFLRVAHYPQDPSVLEACDQLGILASVEIPIVNEITETDSFYNNCAGMLVEMIRQNHNHPSVIIWCYMNEVLLRPHFNNDVARQKIYYANIERLAKRLDSITRKEDPFRITMMANHGDFEKYRNTGLIAIPMVVGWNLYSGWYGGSLKDFSGFLDNHHKVFPGKPFMVTEYGADADPRIRSLKPTRFDKSVEYTTAFHRFYMAEMMKRPFVAGAMAWNLADFNSEGREETMPHINNKGLLTWNRVPKDPYYLYQALLVKKPFIKITSANWLQRTGIADSIKGVCYQPIQVATNLHSVELMLDGKTLGRKNAVDGICEWEVPFRNGKNNIVVKGTRGGLVYEDRLNIGFELLPYHLADTRLPFTHMNILLGASRYYIDEEKKQVWIPDQPYRPGAWGYTGGHPFKLAGNGRLPYGTDKNILGTNDDPVYQTQQVGIQKYQLDVPAGQYELSLHFAELAGGNAKELPYNLSDTGRSKMTSSRVFNVYVNNVVVMESFNISEQYGLATAVVKKIKLAVAENEGVNIEFKPLAGEPVLNALELRKIY